MVDIVLQVVRTGVIVNEVQEVRGVVVVETVHVPPHLRGVNVPVIVVKNEDEGHHPQSKLSATQADSVKCSAGVRELHQKYVQLVSENVNFENWKKIPELSLLTISV